jgi:hypothetical protein
MMTNAFSENWYKYLASRPWRLLHNLVRERSGGICERCENRPMYAAHHLTYIRRFHERLDDLLAVCVPCHEFLHAHSEHDPVEADLQVARDNDDAYRNGEGDAKDYTTVFHALQRAYRIAGYDPWVFTGLFHLDFEQMRRGSLILVIGNEPWVGYVPLEDEDWQWVGQMRNEIREERQAQEQAQRENEITGMDLIYD